MDSKPWYIDSFGEDYFRAYQYARSSENTKKEIDNVVKLLNLPCGSKILDLCCGYGRHSIELTQRGYRVTGFDISDILLQRAKENAKLLGVEVQLVQGDMRELQFNSEFDAVVNLFGSFGFLESEDKDQSVLEQVYKALKPDGLFLQEIANVNAFVRTYHQPSRYTRLPDDLIIFDEREFNILKSRIHIHSTLLYPDNKRVVNNYYMRIYSPPEIIKKLQTANFQVEHCFGSLDGTEITLDSPFMVTLNRKKSDV